MKHRDIEKIVCKYYNLEIKDIYKKTRVTNICFARQLTMYFSMKFLKFTQQSVASIYNQSHCSAIHAKKVVNNYLETDIIKRGEINEIEHLLFVKKEGPSILDIVIKDINLLQIAIDHTNSITELKKAS